MRASPARYGARLRFPPIVKTRSAALIVLAVAAAVVAAVLALGGSKEDTQAKAALPEVPGEPTVTVISPRSGARQTSHAVVVKVKVRNFELSPRHFGGEPQLHEGHIRFSLNRVPDCVYPAKLQRAIDSPFGNGRLVGRSFDFAEYSGPNGILADRIDSAGSYSPATRPEIYLPRPPPRLLPPGHHPRPKRRLDHAVPRGDQLPDPAEARPRPQVRQRQGAERQGRRLRLIPPSGAPYTAHGRIKRTGRWDRPILHFV